MPMTLWTGKPGNGKTLNAIKAIKAQAERENRPVFYSGIKILDREALPWTELSEPEKWYECPDGAIVVIDECQRVFRPRQHGKEPPRHVVELETHRHRGIDMHLITQHPMLADNALRRLCEKHLHVVRSFGMERCTIHEWNEVKETCDKASARQDSIKHLVSYPKEVYSWYKSAEIHTVKRNIPMKFWLLLAAPLVLGGLVYIIYGSVKARIDGTAEYSTPEALKGQGANVRQVSRPNASGGNDQTKPTYLNAEADARQYVFERTARVDGLPHTAPVYDSLTEPTRVPVPAACIYSQGRCQCYTQQATRMTVPHNQCVELAHNGYFEDFDPNGREARERRDYNVKVLEQQDRLPISGASTRDTRQVRDLAAGYGVLGARRDGVREPGMDAVKPAPKG